jgi:glucan phosphoethanolaminetransferase (alkaline phosphatase superfamily)
MRNKYDLKIQNISAANSLIKNIHILSIYVFVAINAILVVWGIQHLLYMPEKMTKIGMFFLILTSVSGVAVSALSIKKVLTFD